jgi:hypothetical protein
MGVAVDPTLQSRIRAIMGLRGGPPIEAEEAVLPVVVVGSWPADRQPNLETGAMIPRRFVAVVEEVVAGAGSHARAGIRAGDVGVILWIRRLWAYSRDAAAHVEAKIGRAAAWAPATGLTAAFTDTRMPTTSIYPSPVDGGANEFAAGANATFRTYIQTMVMGGTGATSAPPTCFEVDEILVTDGVSPDVFTVELVTVDRDLVVAFEGYVFDQAR